MSDTAVWLTEHVIPTVQIRQWVLTLPWEFRIQSGYDRELCAFVLDTLIGELQRSYRWRATRERGLSSMEEAYTGTVTVIQRFDSASRLNVHFHTLELDGVYLKNENDEGLPSIRLPRPTEAELSPFGRLFDDLEAVVRHVRRKPWAPLGQLSLPEVASELKERRKLREVARVIAGAEASVCPRLRTFRREGALMILEQSIAVPECVRKHKCSQATQSGEDASMANFRLCFPYAHAKPLRLP